MGEMEFIGSLLARWCNLTVMSAKDTKKLVYALRSLCPLWLLERMKYLIKMLDCYMALHFESLPGLTSNERTVPIGVELIPQSLERLRRQKALLHH